MCRPSCLAPSLSIRVSRFIHVVAFLSFLSVTGANFSSGNVVLTWIISASFLSDAGISFFFKEHDSFVYRLWFLHGFYLSAGILSTEQLILC